MDRFKEYISRMITHIANKASPLRKYTYEVSLPSPTADPCRYMDTILTKNAIDYSEKENLEWLLKYDPHKERPLTESKRIYLLQDGTSATNQRTFIGYDLLAEFPVYGTETTFYSRKTPTQMRRYLKSIITHENVDYTLTHVAQVLQKHTK